MSPESFAQRVKAEVLAAKERHAIKTSAHGTTARELAEAANMSLCTAEAWIRDMLAEGRIKAVGKKQVKRGEHFYPVMAYDFAEPAKSKGAQPGRRDMSLGLLPGVGRAAGNGQGKGKK
jgi:hypothetical protein